MENYSNKSTEDYAFEMAEMYAVLAVHCPHLKETYNKWNKIAQSYEHSGWKKRTGMTQHDKIITHFKKTGSITVREAMIEYSIASLTKRIQELRELGHAIVSNPKTHKVTGQKYVRYTYAGN